MSKAPFIPTTKKTQQPSISRFFTNKSASNKNVLCETPSPTSTIKSAELHKTGKSHVCLPSQENNSKRSFGQSLNDFSQDHISSTERSSKRTKNTEHSPNGTLTTNENEAANSSKKLKSCSQTGKYLLAESDQVVSLKGYSEEGENVTEREKKEVLHREWIKKIGNMNTRRRFAKNKEPILSKDEESAAEDDEIPKLKKKGAKTGNLTPLEIQVLEIKKKNLDTILIVEVGYKLKFFGEDARIAAKELSIVCIPGKFRYDEHPSEAHLSRFATASIPVHRLSVHAKRLVQAGYKIGVVRQVETPALKKAGDNRNAPFTRKLINVYTRGTYIDDVEEIHGPASTSELGTSATGYLLCLTESKIKDSGTDEKVTIGILAVQPSTGDITYDTFEDDFLRGEIETRIMHLAPCEILIIGELTNATEKLIKHLSGSSANLFCDQIREERMAKCLSDAEAHSHVSQFYAEKMKNRLLTDGENEHNLLEKILNLPKNVTACLSAMITHLTQYGLEHVFYLTKYFDSFSTQSHMLLNNNALSSLEIYLNQTEHKENGSLFWSLDKTQTRFGRRLLRKWVGRPLLKKDQIEQRINAVEELRHGYQTPRVEKIKSLLRSINFDLERSLIRMYYEKCTRPELLIVLQTLQKVANEFTHVKAPSDAGFTSPLLNNAIATLPLINAITLEFLSKICVEPARNDDKYAFFHPDYENEFITDHKMGIAVVEQELDAHRSSASLILKKSKPLSYVTVAGTEYLFEIFNSDLKHVPASWIKISGTKKISRFHSPEVICLLRERDQHKESLSAACDTAFAEFLRQISQHYVPLRDTISALATLDCLHSLSLVAQQPGYVKPHISDTNCIKIIQGRHPMVEQLLSSNYIPNTTNLSSEPGQTRALCITGPNMGGKSSYVRHVAMLVIMAQIGSYLPCESASIGLFDGIYTRMGAYDSILTRQSTFQVELLETASILRNATTRSLVILDELGRGTSTHDGEAIAGSTLEWIVREKKCLTLFITHYQSLASVAKIFKTESALKNVHMKFASNRKVSSTRESGLSDDCCDDEEITFLYEIDEGVSYRSYGLNVARLAQLPKVVLDTATRQSRKLELDAKKKSLHKFSKLINNVIENEIDGSLEQLITDLDEL
ncbi:DNA mismatch repair protein msh3 [Golovinomyces cichoracearum]|uniref:DNA mismatch repair protein n=1 Tax=Golovinomyces cichoracearum TaxID=62708 RepID=A0A420HDZ0_9PEZI|nr:DNA mismatch repair protein msh3 [Golovinomyces cichoracearum]